MVRLTNYIVVFMATFLYACSERTSDILPEDNLQYLEEYHCWPYNVSVYSVDEVKVDSLFNNYPLNSFFEKSSKYKITYWASCNETDTVAWNGMRNTLKECNDNVEIYNSLLKGNSIYFAGMYRNMKISNGTQKRKYEKILFLDLTSNRIHIFKDINKVF